MTANTIILILELIGTVAFALSGAFVAMERQLDYFGIVVLAVTTAVGGGILRDLILGNTPPAAFRSPIYVVVAFFTAAVILVMMHRLGNFVTNGKVMAYLKYLNLCDALGLGIFTVVGMNTAIVTGYGENMFLAVFVGVITGVGGGMVRDILAGRTPLILRREIYALAAIAGGIVYYALQLFIPQIAGMLLATAFITLIRMACLYWQVNLPIADFEEKDN